MAGTYSGSADDLYDAHLKSLQDEGTPDGG